jgi:LytS/YehU family sensor histidine kinase
VQTIAWTIAIVTSLPFYLLVDVSLQNFTAAACLRVLLGLGLTSAIWPLYRRLRRASTPVPLLATGIFILCGLLALLDTFVMSAVIELLQLSLGPQSETLIRATVFVRWLLYAVWSLLYFGITYWRDSTRERVRLAGMEATLRTSELRFLRAQISPHFFFNAMTAIQAEKDRPAVVVAITQALANYLRFSLSEYSGQPQALERELDALTSYLEVQKFRFEERLIFTVHASEEVRSLLVPPALLQPLVENAIKYGQQSSPPPLRVWIRATLEEQLVVEVGNTGHWFATTPETSTGIGLANLRRRLELIAGPTAELTVQAEPEQVRVVLRLPVIKAR